LARGHGAHGSSAALVRAGEHRLRRSNRRLKIN
jgi:hypothetical protein